MENTIRVFETATAAEARKARSSNGTLPEHWVGTSGTQFKNPYPSFRHRGFGEMFSLVRDVGNRINNMVIPSNLDEIIPIHKPTWIVDDTPAPSQENIKATWLGHASFLVEMPTRSPEASRGIRVLFDPIFSERCSPVQWIGPKRIIPTPCKVEELPDIDAIVISHDHYDHLDVHTLRSLYKKAHTPHIFTPPGYKDFLRSIHIPLTHIHELDWWSSSMIEVDVPSLSSTSTKSQASPAEGSPSVKLTAEITSTPSQHNTSRTGFDRLFPFHRLWASWIVKEVLPPTESATQPKSVFFAGDTGYRSVLKGQDEDTAPMFPGFKQIGDKFGGFDLALIPIGAYAPRWFMSSDHCAPQDSVLIFKDIHAKKALAMHWGTFVLTYEPVDEPPMLLKQECKKVGIPDGDFVVTGVGETRQF
ncbi:hypothetical protein ONZ45_g8090 [Pleurotus djamor]|nr:hypothetical protein ONZ45_g8090 [Pleurotus djamor]